MEVSRLVVSQVNLPAGDIFFTALKGPERSPLSPLRHKYLIVPIKAKG